MDSSPLANIYNMLSVADDLGTAGQPTSAQLAAIKAAGYEVVINLATGTTPRDLPNEVVESFDPYVVVLEREHARRVA